MAKQKGKKSFHRCGKAESIWHGLSEWYQTPLGQAFMQAEKQQLDAILPTLFGYHLIQVGQVYDKNMLDASRISHCCIMDIGASPEGRCRPGVTLQGLPDALPLASESVDVVVLPHTLEFSQQPHAVLREVDRVLVPEGHVVMLVFNPWSLWMLQNLIAGWRRNPPWCGRFISSTRTKDWLALLGFDIHQCQRYFFRPPIQASKIMARLDWLERLGQTLWPVMGGSYVLVARKRLETLTPIRPKWQSRKRVVATGLVESMEPHAGKIVQLNRFRKTNEQS